MGSTEVAVVVNTFIHTYIGYPGKMSEFDNDINEDTASRSGRGGVNFQSSNTRLAENSALREAENEVINIITKINTNQDSLDRRQPIYQNECSTTRTKLMDICSQSKMCHSSHIRPAIDDMCKTASWNSDDPLHDMSVRAAEQMICILGVCMLCSGLYFIMIWLEKLFTRYFSEEEQNP